MDVLRAAMTGAVAPAGPGTRLIEIGARHPAQTE
jgi:hypothetical protein